MMWLNMTIGLTKSEFILVVVDVRYQAMMLYSCRDLRQPTLVLNGLEKLPLRQVSRTELPIHFVYTGFSISCNDNSDCGGLCAVSYTCESLGFIFRHYTQLKL